MQSIRQLKRESIPSNEELVSNFLKNVKDSADYVCCSCHRLMFRITVVELHEDRYPKVKPSVLKSVLSYKITSARGKEWICRTCHMTLKRGKMPTQAKANNLILANQPPELKSLNALELRLICQRIPFMKMVGLPRGKQHGIHGPAVNVPAKLDTVCSLFPRLPSETQLIPMKFKRKLEHSSHYMYDYVDIGRVLAALKYLKENNVWYHDVNIRENWIVDAEKDDRELLEAFVCADSNENVPKEDTDIESDCRFEDQKSHNVSTDVIRAKRVTYEICKVDKNSDLEKLNIMAKANDMNVIDVDGDGDCLFHCICYQLKRLDIADLTVKELRRCLSRYMEGNACHYRDFVCALVESDDLLNADTEQPTDQDRVIANISDDESRKELQWIKYLDGIGSKQWGEHIALQAAADMFSLSVIVHTTTNMLEHTILSRSEVKHVFHVGLMRQSHYAIFEPISSSNDKESNDQFSYLWKTDERCYVDDEALAAHEINEQGDNADDDDTDENDVEDVCAFEDASKIRGLPYETSMVKENNELKNKLISVAPAESEKPQPLLSDPNFEELSNPDKYPDGKNTLTADRPIAIGARKYFNQRLLDVDGRFSKSIEYILSAQYAVESKQVQGDINHFVFRRTAGKQCHGTRLNVGLIKNVEKMNELIKCDHAYKILKNVRGTPAYFQTVFYDVLAMVRQLGIPTWFFTVSAADMQWPDVIQTIARQYGTELSDSDVQNLSFADRTMWLRSNPVTAARQFQYRLELMFKDILKSNAHPLGEIIDYVIRIEFQARGSPHAHTLLWVKNAPKLDLDSDEVVCQFIDEHVTCAASGDDSLANFVGQLQTHSHSSYCRKKGSCRFSFPKPPSMQTVVAREPVDEEDMAEVQFEAKKVLKAVHEVLTDAETPDDISMEELLRKAEVEEDEYMQSMKVSQKGNNIILKRDPCEVFINAYNPTILKAWQANIDIQYIVDAYACVMYVAAYMTKDEKGIGELLKQACKEYQDKDIKAMLRRVGSVFLNHREVSAQEAVYRILSMPLKKFSRKVLFVNTDEKSERASVLKPMKDLEGKNDIDEDIFQKNIIDRYVSRPAKLNDVCLAEFAANYSVSPAEREENSDDSVPLILDNSEDAEENDQRDSLPKCIKLKNGNGVMHKRKFEAVIRFRKFNSEKDSINFYRAKLMLYLPWRNEDRDLIGEYQDFESHYHAVFDRIRSNEVRFTQNLELIDQAIHENAVYGPPEHAWPNIAPGAEHANLQDVNEGVEVVRDIDQDDLEANAEMFETPGCGQASELVARYQAEADRELISPSDYRKMVRGLNKKQKQIVFYHRSWCKNAVIALKNGQKINPYRIFLSGPGGVGKTHVIRLIHSDTRKLLALSRIIKPNDVTVLLTAPTGVAAFNVGGMTVHSALLLRVQKYGKGGEPLTFEKLNTLRSKLENLQLVIIDEVSMIGSDMLLNIHKRLSEIKGESCDSLFGNVCILAVGDLYQLPPVRQSHIYDPVRDRVERLNGSLWKDHFQLHELDEVMRQKDDQTFAEMLCRIRVGKQTENDIEVLKSRVISPDDENYPEDALHVYALNRDVDERNETKLKLLAPLQKQRVFIVASDDKSDSTGLVNLQNITTSKKRSETAGLHTVLILAEGARVMLTYNIDTADGLVNGVIGTVNSFVKNDKGKVLTVLVDFDDEQVGLKTKTKSQWSDKYPTSVPIMRHEGKFEKDGKKGAQIARRQFPLTLAWAVTIHKCQGLTVDEIVVSMKNSRQFGQGQAYVAFSRVRSLSGLYITDFDAKGIRTSSKIELEMNEMRDKSVPLIPVPRFLELSKPEWITVGHLNVHYFLEKISDLNSGCEYELLAKTDVMCFTETYLTPEHEIDQFSRKHNYVVFREDVPEERNHAGKHGIMICASATLRPLDLPLISVKGLESKVVILTTSASRFVVAAIYRKPSHNMDDFMQLLESLLTLMPLNIPTIVIGDFNDNILNQKHSSLEQFMERNGFKQYVCTATTDSGSLLDHIYFNRHGSEFGDAVQIDVHDVYYSDHDAVFLTTNCL